MAMFRVTMFLATVAMALGIAPQGASAQECSDGLCGTPDQSGGGCGCGCGSILVAMTDRGDTYQFADDIDGDGIEDEFDNCPFTQNFEQLDGDGDAIGDGCDLCVNVADPNQQNLDGDNLGDACDDDVDNDTIANAEDNCPNIPNLDQSNTDVGIGLLPDGDGDACDDDDDGDGIVDTEDPCRQAANDPITLELVGAACPVDDPDGDGIDTSDDNCPFVRNTVGSDGFQPNVDGDEFGDACDVDIDDDGIANFLDNCAMTFNPDQIDVDRDGLGDAGFLTDVGTCDQQECYVLPGEDASTCLDPNVSFKVLMGLQPSIRLDQIQTGDEVVLQLFTNRPGLTHNWEALFGETPSSDNIVNALGSGATPDLFPEVRNCMDQDTDGACIRYNNIRFTPTEPGTYEVVVNVELPDGDPQNLGRSAATARITVDVGGEGSGGGCAAGTHTSLLGLALGLLVFTRRRKS